MPNVSSTKRERVERIIKGHEIRDGNDVWGGGGGGFGVGEAKIRHEITVGPC